MKRTTLFGIILLFSTACTGSPVARTPEAVRIATATVSIPTELAVESPTPQDSKTYIGLEYPPFPEEVVESYAVVIQGSDRYAVSLVEDTKYKMLWLSKLTQVDAAGKAHWKVTDVLPTQDLNENEMFYSNGCLLNDVFDYEIIALGKWDDDVDSSRYVPNSKIFQAWRANLETELFEEMQIEGVECVAEFQFR